MENKDVLALLEKLNIPVREVRGGSRSREGYESDEETSSQLRSYAESNATGFSTRRSSQDVVSQLMNTVLQCLGALRTIVVEEEKARVSDDCVAIDSSERMSGTASLLQRQIFAQAATTLLDTILIGREIHANDPMKDLVECFPNQHQVQSGQWLMLNWAIMQSFCSQLRKPPSDDIKASQRGRDDDNDEYSLVSQNTTTLVKSTLRYFPKTISEVDKFGQIYLSYAIRCQSSSLLEILLRFHKAGALQRDGRGKFALHYAAAYSQDVEPLLMLSEAMNRTLSDLSRHCMDQFENLPIHFAATGNSSPVVLEELLFNFPDSAKIANVDGQLPLHIAALNSDIDKVKAIFRAFPDAISIPDKHGWLPLQHATFGNRNFQVVQFLAETFPTAVKLPNKSGRIPLHYAVVKCVSVKVVQYLLQIYPDGARIMDVNQRLPLHNLIARTEYWSASRLKCLRLLLEAFPVAANSPDKDRRTPYDLAVRDGHGSLIERLLLRADPSQDPEKMGELCYLASKSKYRSKRSSSDRSRSSRSSNGDERRRSRSSVASSGIVTSSRHDSRSLRSGDLSVDQNDHENDSRYREEYDDDGDSAEDDDDTYPSRGYDEDDGTADEEYRAGAATERSDRSYSQDSRSHK